MMDIWLDQNGKKKWCCYHWAETIFLVDCTYPSMSSSILIDYKNDSLVNLMTKNRLSLIIVWSSVIFVTEWRDFMISITERILSVKQVNVLTIANKCYLVTVTYGRKDLEFPWRMILSWPMLMGTNIHSKEKLWDKTQQNCYITQKRLLLLLLFYLVR